jgi:hypothetical protein
MTFESATRTIEHAMAGANPEDRSHPARPGLAVFASGNRFRSESTTAGRRTWGCGARAARAGFSVLDPPAPAPAHRDFVLRRGGERAGAAPADLVSPLRLRLLGAGDAGGRRARRAARARRARRRGGARVRRRGVGRVRGWLVEGSLVRRRAGGARRRPGANRTQGRGGGGARAHAGPRAVAPRRCGAGARRRRTAMARARRGHPRL